MLHGGIEVGRVLGVVKRKKDCRLAPPLRRLVELLSEQIDSRVSVIVKHRHLLPRFRIKFGRRAVHKDKGDMEYPFIDRHD